MAVVKEIEQVTGSFMKINLFLLILISITFSNIGFSQTLKFSSNNYPLKNRTFYLENKIVFVQTTFAQNLNCVAKEHQEFDFWLGSWNIKQKILKADGTWFESKAKTKVTKILDGCAIQENWEGEVQFFWEGMTNPEKIKALSVRSFDVKTKKWTIYWMDTQSPQFTIFEGNFNNGKGEFYRKITDENGKQTIIRITFSEIKSNSVRWDLAVSSDDSKTFSTLWIMEMRRREKRQR